MGDWLFEVFREHFRQHGYWTVFVTLMLENAGIPVPGETVLLFASFLVFSERDLQLVPLLLLGTAAATLGDNVGYAVGKSGGRPLLDRYRGLFRISEGTIKKGERIFRHHGQFAIFFARFIFGLRIVAGPLAGVLKMPWKKFALFNALGAITWVTTITLIGYKFGQHWEQLVRAMGRANLAIGVLILFAGMAWWRWYRSHTEAGDQS